MVPTYTTLAKRVINEKGRPTTTAELMEYVGRHRRLDQDAEKAKIRCDIDLAAGTPGSSASHGRTVAVGGLPGAPFQNRGHPPTFWSAGSPNEIGAKCHCTIQVSEGLKPRREPAPRPE